MMLSIVIPVYKGEDTLVPLYAKIKEALDGKFDFEVIFLSDNATDNSWSKIQYLHRNDPERIKGLKLKYNYGQHKAILYGMNLATGKYIVTIDEDMQHDPEYIPPMLAFMIEKKFDVLYGKFREYRKNSLRKLESDIVRRIAGSLIPYVHSDYSPYRIIRHEIVNDLNCGKGTVFLDAILGRAASNMGTYIIDQRVSGRSSSYTYVQRGLLALSIFISYSRLFSWLDSAPKKRKTPEVTESIGL